MLRKIEILVIFVLMCSPAFAAELSANLEVINQVQLGGSGNREAAAAWKQVAAAKPQELETILSAIDGSKPLAANWLRMAVETIAERSLVEGTPLPVKRLERFALNTEHDSRARRLAFEWLRRADATAADRLIPGFLHDPSVEFRRDAVDRLLREGRDRLAKDETVAATTAFETALGGARDTDQVNEIVKQLRALGKEVDVPEHFGFLMNWQVIGPFDNTALVGFANDFPPEHEFKADARYPGKSGEVRWTSFSTDDDFGMVDLNQPLGKLKEVVGYARTTFVSDREQEVELRLGCKNAWKVWLNGELLFGRDEYHRGIQIDQYRMPAKLRAGTNDIMIKV